jgi:hypothetical protein
MGLSNTGRLGPEARGFGAGTVAAMGERTEYLPGTFCWTDLSTTD